MSKKDAGEVPDTAQPMRVHNNGGVHAPAQQQVTPPPAEEPEVVYPEGWKPGNCKHNDVDKIQGMCRLCGLSIDTPEAGEAPEPVAEADGPVPDTPCESMAPDAQQQRDTPPPASLDMAQWVKTVIDDVTLARYHTTLDFHDVFDPTAMALDVGCFVGWFTNMIPIPAVGIDTNKEYIAWANFRYKTAKTFYEVMDARTMKFIDEFFHIAYVCEVLEHHHEPNADAIMKEVLRVVKPGASIIVCVPSPGWSFMVDQDHKTDFEEKWFKLRFNVVNIVKIGERHTAYHIKKA